MIGAERGISCSSLRELTKIEESLRHAHWVRGRLCRRRSHTFGKGKGQYAETRADDLGRQIDP